MQVIKFENVTKVYRLGVLGSGTLVGDVQSFFARIKGKEDPNVKIGVENKKGLFTALSDISFSIEKGQTVGILGRNGAGKSTLLKLLSKITSPTSGNIYYNGKISSMLEIGTGFHPELTGKENIYLNGAILGMTKKEIAKKYNDIVEFSEIGKFIDTPVKRYSSGMYVKLAFSVASNLDSDIILMDEVLAVGDGAFRKKCIEKLQAIARDEGRTVLCVSHNMNTIRRLCNRVLVLDGGKLVFDGDVEEGIAYYQKTSSSVYPIEMDFSKLDRFKGLTLDSILKKYKIVGGNPEKVYDKLDVEFTFESKTELNNAHLNFAYYDGEGECVGSTETDDILTFKKGENIVKCTLDLSMLKGGSYYVKTALYTDDKEMVFVDIVLESLRFFKEEEGVILSKQNYGSIRLPKTKTIVE